MERTDTGGDFIERFLIFRDSYDRAGSKDEKSYLAEEFLKSCTEEEVTLVREVIGDVLHKKSLNLSVKASPPAYLSLL